MHKQKARPGPCVQDPSGRELSVRDTSARDPYMGWGSVSSDVGSGSECSDPCETCLGTKVRKNHGSDGCKSDYWLDQASDPKQILNVIPQGL